MTLADPCKAGELLAWKPWFRVGLISGMPHHLEWMKQHASMSRLVRRD